MRFKLLIISVQILCTFYFFTFNMEAQSLDFDSLRDSSVNLKLMSTVMSKNGNSKAILKNPVTADLKGYKVGEKIDIIPDYNMKILRIVPCKIVLEVNGFVEKIECEKGNEEVRVELAKISKNSLDEFKIVPPRFLLLKKRYSDKFDKEIVKACIKFDVDPQLVKALIKAESNFDQFAVSHKNAEGLMQLMPETAKELGVNNSFDPEDNIEGGVKFFRDLLDHFENDLSLSIAAYNAGKNAVIKYGNEIPPYPETQKFVKRVLGFYDELSIN